MEHNYFKLIFYSSTCALIKFFSLCWMSGINIVPVYIVVEMVSEDSCARKHTPPLTLMLLSEVQQITEKLDEFHKLSNQSRHLEESLNETQKTGYACCGNSCN